MNHIMEYLCDYCDSVFKSPLLVRNHQKKSCLGVNTEKDERDQWKKIKYLECLSSAQTTCDVCGIVFMEIGIEKTGKEWKEWNGQRMLKGVTCGPCKEQKTVYKMAKAGYICCWQHYVKKYH